MSAPGYCRACDVFGAGDTCWLCGHDYAFHTWPQTRGAHENIPNGTARAGWWNLEEVVSL